VQIIQLPRLHSGNWVTPQTTHFRCRVSVSAISANGRPQRG